MKKLLVLVLLALGYVGASYYAGVLGEARIREQIALSQARPDMKAVTLELSAYERGIFSSHFILSARLPLDGLPGEAATITGSTKVTHGPVILAQGIKFGLFYADTYTAVATEDAEINATIAAIFGDSVGRLGILGKFDGSYHSTWFTGEVSYEGNGNRFHADGLQVTTDGRFDSLDSNSDFTLGAITHTFADETQLQLAQANGNVSVQVVDGDLPLADVSATTDSFSVAQPGGQSMTMTGLHYLQVQTVKGDLVDGTMRFTVDKVDGMMPLSDVYYEVAAANLPVEGLRAWSQLPQDVSSDDPALQVALAQTLTEDIKVDIGVGAKVMDGRFMLDITSAMAPNAMGVALADVSTPQDYVNFVKSDIELRISQSVVTNSPLILFLAEYIDTHLIADGDDYVGKATLSEGVLDAAGMQFPLLSLFSMYLPPAE